jgi:hypothetical protein
VSCRHIQGIKAKTNEATGKKQVAYYMQRLSPLNSIGFQCPCPLTTPLDGYFDRLRFSKSPRYVKGVGVDVSHSAVAYTACYKGPRPSIEPSDSSRMRSRWDIARPDLPSLFDLKLQSLVWSFSSSERDLWPDSTEASSSLYHPELPLCHHTHAEVTWQCALLIYKNSVTPVQNSMGSLVIYYV